MRTEQQLLNQLRELREIANTLPHPDYFLTKEIARSPRIKVFAQIRAVLDELETRFGYVEPEQEHPVKWVNDLFQRLGIKRMSGKQNVSIRGTVLSNGTYVSVEYVRIGDKIYYEDGRILDLANQPTEESRTIPQDEIEKLRAAAEEIQSKIPPIYPSFKPKSRDKSALDA